MRDEGHEELMELIGDAQRQAHSRDGIEFSGLNDTLILALRNMALRITTLERDMRTAEETIERLEGK